MTFEEWLELDEGVRRFGMQLREDWVAAAKAGWEAAIESEKTKTNTTDILFEGSVFWDFDKEDKIKLNYNGGFDRNLSLVFDGKTGKLKKVYFEKKLV